MEKIGFPRTNRTDSSTMPLRKNYHGAFFGCKGSVIGQLWVSDDRIRELWIKTEIKYQKPAWTAG